MSTLLLLGRSCSSKGIDKETDSERTLGFRHQPGFGINQAEQAQPLLLSWQQSRSYFSALFHLTQKVLVSLPSLFPLTPRLGGINCSLCINNLKADGNQLKDYSVWPRVLRESVRSQCFSNSGQSIQVIAGIKQIKFGRRKQITKYQCTASRRNHTYVHFQKEVP